MLRRVAVLNDIHGNLPALEAVLHEVRTARVDAVVVGGDVLPGPMPRESLERLGALDVGVHYLYGNGEVAVLAQLAGEVPAAVPEPYRPLIAWTAARIDPAQRDAIAQWPKTLRLDIDGLGDVLFCHGTPRDENEIFTSTTEEARLHDIFAGVDAPVVVCGHTHVAFDRIVGRTRVVNAGSVGLPFGGLGADWLLLAGGRVEPRHTGFDRAAAIERLRATTCPESMLALFL